MQDKIAAGFLQSRSEALNVKIGGKSIWDAVRMPISESRAFFSTLKLTDAQKEIARRILKEVNERLGFLSNVGLDMYRASAVRRMDLPSRLPAEPTTWMVLSPPSTGSSRVWRSASSARGSQLLVPQRVAPPPSSSA